MPAKDRDSIDRRDFMTGSLAAVGGSAIVVSEAGAAQSQQSEETGGSGSGTEYTGEAIQGKKVVSQLDVADLEPGKKHFLYFQGVQTPAASIGMCRWSSREAFDPESNSH